MKIKIFGRTFTTGNDKLEEEKEKVFAVTIARANNSDKKLFSRKLNNLHPLTKAINWPLPKDDPISRAFFLHHVLDFDYAASHGRFNICPITALGDEFKLLNTPYRSEGYDNLRKLHCINFELMEKELIEALPGMINAVFNEHRFEKDVTDDSSEGHS